jgi:hypothetical protein
VKFEDLGVLGPGEIPSHVIYLPGFSPDGRLHLFESIALKEGFRGIIAKKKLPVDISMNSIISGM